ncbi:hypothetical protein ACQBAU_06080 [Propionibacteriaceae bacterium Y2011]|uniref:sunset domain-containing protein n=1 Tax=Microlunatus sp. Y2014 TaxID=3418488 RepID=UPI003B488D5C
MKRKKKEAAVDTAAGRLAVQYWPAAEGLAQRVDPYRQQFVDRVGPLAEQARKSGASAAHDALERITPVLDDAWERVTPAVESARESVQGKLLPRLNDVLAEAAGHPAAQEASKRGRATAAALRGELEVPKPKRKLPRILGGIAIGAAVAGIAVVALRKLLDNRDAEWEAPAPSTYGGSNTPKRADTSPWAAASDPATRTASPAAAPTASGPGTTGEATSEPTTAADAGASGTDSTASTAKPESAGLSGDAGETVAPFERRSYGAGSYVGSKPPTGFDVKGNERSMKYHTPDSPAYERTISDVWFNSAEAAEQNGFVRAQR